MSLHEVLRADLKAIEGLLERMEFEARQIRALISTTRLIADDLQVIEEGAVETLACGHEPGACPVEGMPFRTCAERDAAR